MQLLRKKDYETKKIGSNKCLVISSECEGGGMSCTACNEKICSFEMISNTDCPLLMSKPCQKNDKIGGFLRCSTG